MYQPKLFLKLLLPVNNIAKKLNVINSYPCKKNVTVEYDANEFFSRKILIYQSLFV